MKLISLDSSGSFESIYVYFNTINAQKYKLKHFEADWKRIISLIWSVSMKWPEKQK